MAMPSGLPSRDSISADKVLTIFMSQMRLVPRRGLSVGKRWWNSAMPRAETEKSSLIVSFLQRVDANTWAGATRSGNPAAVSHGAFLSGSTSDPFDSDQVMKEFGVCRLSCPRTAGNRHSGPVEPAYSSSMSSVDTSYAFTWASGTTPTSHGNRKHEGDGVPADVRP
ncbi:hypothetical protein ABZ820_03700 [Streptomyces diacarni]|uniref:hypothetical protein n=1 Tax=Streptomyces diacarni TaxID=2800381 RepID=UPI00340517D4